MPASYYIPLGEYLDSLWPKNILEPPPVDQIKGVWMEPPNFVDEPSPNLKTAILIEQELALRVPGVDGVGIVLAAAGEDSAFLFEFFTNPSPGMKIYDVPISIRFAKDLLKPAKLSTDAEGNQVVVPDTTRDFVDITLAKITLIASFDGGFDIDVEGGIDLPLCFIGDTGVAVEAKNIRFVGQGDPAPPGRPAGWTGVHIPSASLWLPGDLGNILGHLNLTDATIGNGGFSGTVTDTWSPALAASLGGMELNLQSVDLTFVQNSFTACAVHGSMTLPFFDVPVDVELGINLDGSFSVRLASPNGLLNLNKPGILELQVQSLGFSWVEQTFTVRLSGKVRPLVGGLDWPGFEVKELSIDSKGNVKIEGGWIDLRDGFALDFNGFKIEISKIGFGKTDDGGKWIGFSGGMRLVDGLSAGASVEGLKVTWYEDGRDPKLTLEGVGVEFEVPDVVSFKGRIRYREFLDSHGDMVKQFDGDIKLKLITLGLEIDAVLVVGSAIRPDGRSYTFFAIYLAVELPAGIPLWTTGLGLYGLAGLFALQMEPDKHADEPWYGVGPSDGWYKRPQIGVTDLAGKWRNEEGSLAIGGGLTLGTVADNGFTFSGRMLLVLVFPGPIIMIEGKANMLKERSKLSDEPIFRALAVLDGRAGTLLFGLDAQYKVADNGELLDIRGGVEAFFDFNDLNKWHLYLGLDEPREKRIRAGLFSLFEANAYFMLTAQSLRTGAWVGYDKTWKFGPVKITLEAWLETNVAINSQPIHFHGDLWAHGKVELRVFGFGFGLSLDGMLAGDIFDPFHILASISVTLELPWPLPDVEVDITLEWGPEPDKPPIPLVLKEVAVEHFKTTTSWPLARNTLLLPNYGTDGFIAPASGPTVPANLASAPVVPLDCRPHVTFGRAVHDAALVGNNPQPPNPPEERIGDPKQNQGPARVRYTLRGVALEKLVGATWSAVARKADTANPAGVPELYGSWAPVPAMPGGSSTGAVAQVKLWLWSKSAFDYTLNTSGSWDEWFTENYPSYPCVPDPPSKHVCCNFTRYRVGQPLDVPHVCDPDVLIFGYPPKSVDVERVRPPGDGLDRAACFPPESMMLVRFTRPARHVDVHLVPRGSKLECTDFDGLEKGRHSNPLLRDGIEYKVLNKDGRQAAAVHIDGLDGVSGLSLGFETDLRLAEPTDGLTLDLFNQGDDIKVEAHDEAGTLLTAASVTPAQEPRRLTLDGKGILSVRLFAPGRKASLRRVCRKVGGNVEVFAIAELEGGAQTGQIHAQGDHVVVHQDGVVGLVVRGRGQFCVLEVCVDLGPDPADVLNHQEMAAHLQSATAQWSQVGNVLEPNSAYRIVLETRAVAIGEAELAGWTETKDMVEYAYFRTEGPPGLTTLSLPANVQDPEKFDSGLDDLVRYVRQTVPATVPAPGQKPLLPKPVYRAYDVGVEFNEDYVDLMYRIAGRDLGLYLFDNNNRPVRDAAGRLIVRPNQWGAVETTTFNASETRWLQVVNTGTCALIDESTVPKDVKLDSGAPGQVLEPDAVHEARLVPLLLHESWSKPALGSTISGPSGTLGRWRVVDQGSAQGPSVWKVAANPAPVSRYILQESNIWGGGVDGSDPVKPGTMLVYTADPDLAVNHPDQPARWTDYRLTAFLRSEDDDVIGLVFRYVDQNNYYRFSMDAERAYRRIVRVVNGQHSILVEDDRRYLPDVDYAVTVEAVGASQRVYVDGELILAAEDPSHAAGSIGLYCWASAKARFSDVKVDDFRNADPVTKRPSPAYRFPFTTSKFAHFTHHVQSFDDRIWSVALAGNVATAPWFAAAALPTTVASEAEARAFDALAHAALGSTADAFPKGLEVTKILKNGHLLGYLVQNAEPFDWLRLEVGLSSAPVGAQMPTVPPGALKIVSASFATNLPKEEALSLVTREALDLRGHAVDVFRLPGPVKGSVEEDLLFDDFTVAGLGVQYDESFGVNALDRYQIIDQGNLMGPSAWSVTGGAIRQTSNIAGGALDAAHNAKPGTMALTGDPDWADVRLIARLLSTDNDAIGLVFRCKDAQNYYRLSLDKERSYRRLVKCVGGVFTTLWEDMTASYPQNVAFDLQIDAYGERLTGTMNGVPLFDVVDGSHRLGRIGLYCWMNVGANFQSVRVETLEADPVLDRPDTSSLETWIVLDPEDALDGPSAWTPGPNGMAQTSLVRTAGPDQIGAHLVTGRPRDDSVLSVDFASSSEGALGVLLRYVDKSNFYRLTFHRADNVRKLEKFVRGVRTVLWQTVAGFDLGRTYSLTVRTQGSQLSALLDGVPLFTVVDHDLPRGSVGLTTLNNDDALFSRLLVQGGGRTVAGYRIYDSASGRSAWSTRHGELRQRSALGQNSAPHLGTHAIIPLETTGDLRLTVQARSDSDRPFGVVFRYRDERNYYRFSVSTADHVRRLVKVVDGVATTLWEVAGGYAPGISHRIVVDTLGDRLVGAFDGQRLFDLRDSSHRRGFFGLYACLNDAVAFDTVRISVAPIEAYKVFGDRFATGDLTGWSFVNEATVGAPPNWAAAFGVLTQSSLAYSPPSGAADIKKKGAMAVAGDPTWTDVVFRARVQSNDSRASGVVFRYVDTNNYYRFSMDRTLQYRRLIRCVGGVFKTLWQDDFAYNVGQTYELTLVMVGDLIWGYLDDVPMFSVTDASQPAGRIGLYTWRNPNTKFSCVSVLSAEAAFSDWAFRDNFPYLVRDRWRFVDTGDMDGPSDWSVNAGFLVQTSQISGGDPGMGTYAVSDKESRDWTDSRLTASVGSTVAGGAVGLCARFRDPDNHYRFEMRPGNAGSRLVKVVAGAETELWSGPRGYTVSSEAVVSLDCLGQRISVAWNGVLLCELVDSDLTKGRIALYSSNAPGARFGFVRVQEAVWQPYHRFAKHPTVSAGQRIRVLACSPESAPASLVNTLDVFLAGPGESGSVRLRGSIADMRLRDPLGRIGHTKTFRRSSVFAPVADFRVLRRLDGCAFFLCRPTGDPEGARLPATPYRLTLRHRRDNTAQVPGSQVQKENGSSTDEVTWLDLD